MTSTHPQLLDSSFDPHAIHPFTNGCGLAPQPPKPSQYPIPIPSPRKPSVFAPTYSEYYGDFIEPSPASPSASELSNSPSSPVCYMPKPRRGPMSPNSTRLPSSPKQPIFTPFRKDTSSPDLVLKKKAPSTKSAGTQTHATSPKSRYPILTPVTPP